MMQYVIWVIKTSLSFDIMRIFDSILKFESYDLMGNFVRVLVNITLFYPQEDVNINQLLIRSNYAPYSWNFLRPSGHFLTDQIPPYFWVICVSLSALKTGLSGKQHPWLGCLLETALCPRAESLVWSRAVGTRAFGPRADSTRSYQRFVTRAQCCFYANILVMGVVFL